MSIADQALTEDLASRDDMIVCTGVSKWFDDFQALKGVDVTVKDREVMVVLGPSGSGKSTLIRCINRLEVHQEGSIVVDGIELTNDTRNIERIRSEVGMVFQQFNLFPHLSVIDNITLAPVWVRKKSKVEAEQKAMELLERVGIPEQAQKYPGQLSGGQQQRVAIARSIVNKPKILFADEPTGNLDIKSSGAITDLLFSLKELINTTLVLVTHDLSLAEKCDEVFELSEGQLL